MTPDTMMLLPSASQNGTASRTSAALARKFPPGRSGRVSPRVALVPLATTNDHHSGYAEPSRNAVRRP